MKNNNIHKIVLTEEETTLSWECPDDNYFDLGTLMTAFKGLLIAAGYHEKNINDYIKL